MLRMLGAFLLGIVMGAAGLFFTQITSKNEQIVSTAAEVPAATASVHSNELALLREENAHLKQQLTQSNPDKKIAAENQPVAPQVSPSTANCDAQIKGLMSFYAEKDRTLAELTSIKDPAQYDAKLNAEFMAEPRDEKWSHATETKIEHELSSRDEMRDFVLSDVQCRAATCSLKIPASDLEAKNKIMAALSTPGALSGMGFGDQYSMKSALESAAGEMVIYISKK